MTITLSDPWVRVNLILALGLAVLLLIDRWPAQASKTQALTGLTPHEVSDIRIERQNRLTLHIQRTLDGWSLRYPNDSKARPQRVQQLLAITRATVQRTLPIKSTLVEYGLDKPSAIVQFDQTRLAFGERDPSQRNRYVLVDDEIRLVDDVYFNLLTLPAQHFTGD